MPVPRQSRGISKDINREGNAVPVVVGQSISSTDIYPGRVLSKTETVSDQLAERVVDVLMKQSVNINVDRVPYKVSWTVASNYSTVRRLLRTLIGPDYAESSGFPLPRRFPAWFFHAGIILGELTVFVVVVILLRTRSNKRINFLKKQYDDTRCELLESRAERQRFNTILTLAGCGIDIVDDKNQIVYADTGLEREYGDWHGRKCHDYFCGSNKPCTNCRRPSPSGEQRQIVLDIDGSQPIPDDDAHAKTHYIAGKSNRIIGTPFRDEGGRWLYARIHFPLEAFATVNGSSD